MEVIFTNKFLDRLEECSDYIALGNESAARKWVESIWERCGQLRSHPEMGRVVPEFLRPEIRELIHGDYRLVYKRRAEQIDMLTIWHSSQQHPEDMKE